MAVSVYPLSKDCLKGQKLPANISPDEWDSFHDLIIIDEIARCGYLGVIWGLACMLNILCLCVNFLSTDRLTHRR